MHDSQNTATVTDPGHLLPDHTAEEAPRSGHTRLILVLVALVLVGAFIAWRIHTSNVATQQEAAKTAAAANRAIPVQVAPVKQMTVPVFLTALGTVTAYNTVTINTRVDGQILQVYFKEGQAVRKGQLLLQIDPRPYQAALDQAIGTLAKDEANLKNMEAEAQRYTALYQAGVVSKEQQQLEVSNQGQAAGSIKSDQAAIEAARVNLAYTRITSPIDGVVGLRQVDPGNIVNTGQTTGLVVITQVHPIAVIFTLPEDQLAKVQKAMKASPKPLVVEAYDRSDAHKIAAGTLLTIDNQIDTTTGTAKLKAVFDNADNSLFANQFVNIRLILSERPNATVVPTAAISSGNQGDFVFVVNPGPTPEAKRKNKPAATDATGKVPADEEEIAKSGDAKSGDAKQQKPKFHADQVNVHVDFTIGTNSILSDGALQPNQQVVVDGQEKLVDGGNVTPQQAKGTPGGQRSGGGASSSSAGAAQPTTSTQNDGINGANSSSNNATGGSANSSNGSSPR
jgi:multidrug efflux system membrane fusion protein